MSSSHRGFKKLSQEEVKESRESRDSTNLKPPASAKPPIIHDELSDTEDAAIPIKHTTENHEPTIQPESIFQMVMGIIGSTCCGNSLRQHGFIATKNMEGKREYRIKQG